MNNPGKNNTFLKGKNIEYFENYLNHVVSLPAIPTIVNKVLQVIDYPTTSGFELGRIIRNDQGLSAKILAIANSPFYGIPKRVSTIELAIVILGFEQVKNITFALSVLESLSSASEQKWNKKEYWKHSFITGSVAKKIADDLGYAKSGEAFTAGLLHDLGIPVIHKYFNKEYNEIFQSINILQKPVTEIEENILGINHQQVGSILTKNWNLPESLSEAVMYHHNPSSAVNFTALVSIVHLADYIVHKFYESGFGWDNNMEIDLNIISYLSLGDETGLDIYINSFTGAMDKHIESLTFLDEK